MRFLGAKVIITPPPARGTGMVKKAVELAEKNGWFLTRHRQSSRTKPTPTSTPRPPPGEILRDFEGAPSRLLGHRLRHRREPLKGVARVLADKRPDTKIVVCEPVPAPMLSSGQPQPRNPDGTPTASHPAWTPHPQQGWSPDFIPKLAQDAVDAYKIDRVLRIANPEAMSHSHQLALKEGIFVGICSGATFAGSTPRSRRKPPRRFHSSSPCSPTPAERYLSTPLFAEVPVDMTPKNSKSPHSTPTAQLQPPTA